MENQSTVKRSYTGYIGVMYRQKVKENLRAGLPVEEAIELAQESMDNVPKVVIEDDWFNNPLSADYMDSQVKEVYQ